MAKKVEDLRKYFQEIAAKNGISQDVVAKFNESLGDESVARAFRTAFVPVSEHHSAMDELRNNADAEIAKWNNWYEKEAKPAYESNVAGIERLRQYEERYGAIDPDDTTRSQAKSFGFKSKDEFDQYLDNRLKSERAGYISLTKEIPRMSVDYYSRFQKVLDPNEVEKISVEKGLPPAQAYDEYIKPMVEEARQKEWETKLKEAEERGYQEALSKHNLPVDSEPKDFSPFFDRTVENPKEPVTELEQDRESHGGFMDGWTNFKEAKQ